MDVRIELWQKQMEVGVNGRIVSCWDKKRWGIRPQKKIEWKKMYVWQMVD